MIIDHGTAIATWPDWWGFKMEAFDAIPHNAALVKADGGVVAAFVIGHGLSVWNTRTGELLAKIAGTDSANFAISPDGSMFAVSSNVPQLAVDVYRTGETEPYLRMPARWNAGSRLAFNGSSKPAIMIIVSIRAIASRGALA